MIRMGQETVNLDIRGKRPRTFGDENYEGPWRRYIANYLEQQKANGRIPESHVRATDNDRFEVWMSFYLVEESRPQDLDNLSKPVLDTLFCDRYSRKHVKGALYQVDDYHVWKLHLEKRLVESEREAGVSITISLL